MLCQCVGTSRKKTMHALKFSHDVSSPGTIGDISQNNAEQRTTVGGHSAMCIKVQKVQDSFAAHQHIPVLKYLRCIFDVIISRIISVILRRYFRNDLRSIGDVVAMFSPVNSISISMISAQ